MLICPIKIRRETQLQWEHLILYNIQPRMVQKITSEYLLPATYTCKLPGTNDKLEKVAEKNSIFFQVWLLFPSNWHFIAAYSAFPTKLLTVCSIWWNDWYLPFPSILALRPLLFSAPCHQLHQPFYTIDSNQSLLFPAHLQPRVVLWRHRLWMLLDDQLLPKQTQ